MPEGDTLHRAARRLQPRDRPVHGRPWLVVRGSSQAAILTGGPVLELSGRTVRRLGPDVLADPPDLDAMLRNLRGADPGLALGEALLDQRLVAGVGNLWRAEALWHARLSPWLPLGQASDGELSTVLAEAVRLMRLARRGPRATADLQARGPTLHALR